MSCVRVRCCATPISPTRWSCSPARAPTPSTAAPSPTPSPSGSAAAAGLLSREDLAGYRAVAREPLQLRYRDREILTNPAPSAGGTLIAYSLALLDRGPSPPLLPEVVAAMSAAQAERTPEFLEGLQDEGYSERFLARRLGSTTHISVLDADGRACSATCTNGEGSAWSCPERDCT